MKSYSPFLLLLAIVLVSCQRSGTSAIPIDEKLVTAYAQVLALNQQYRMARSASDSAEYHRKVQQVLSDLGFTEESFRAGIIAQFQSAETSHRFQDSVTARLEARTPKL